MRKSLGPAIRLIGILFPVWIFDVNCFRAKLVQIKPNLDFNYTFQINLEPNEILFSALKQSENSNIRSDFGLI